MLRQKVSVSAIGRILGVHRLTADSFIKTRKLREDILIKLTVSEICIDITKKSKFVFYVIPTALFGGLGKNPKNFLLCLEIILAKNTKELTASILRKQSIT